MDMHKLTRELNVNNEAKIVLVVADGLGGLPMEPGGPTELEAAATPYLDELARHNTCGLMYPVLPGITPGSGPGHLGLFGYDPLQYAIGRGVLEALGIDFDLGPDDVAVRGNFCTVDGEGLITDRRAGRIPTETCAKLVEKLRAIRLPDVQLFVEPVRDYRFVIVFRAAGLEGEVEDTDPQRVGARPLEPKARHAGAQRTAELAAQFVHQAREILRHDRPANMLTLRGFAKRPDIPTMRDVYGLRAAAIAVYPMYRGLARLVGMTLPARPLQLEDQLNALRRHWDEFDFFFLHYKYTDSTGEDGNFPGKVKHLEHLDAQIPTLLSLKPAVLIVTGDHSTPCRLRSHSWHPVPVLLAAETCRPDRVSGFGERECLHGGLGQFEARYLLPLALAHAGRLQKYGA
ncbi:MAG TPA: 2,3-bisphosphoglycerate-independent phosphoglycerate mutase [Phycisphaerae bacterium]|nr:2,3-bisphosphoglycerate-independent phosphoglycerate mutase [Phycisphaerae bacterium]HNU44628.1 2,3-bisphosphoglycerate-independent phosphoglycerate mutase [Phycisphaerae bacterium]